MSEQQFEARSATEAAIKACEALGTTRAQLRYRIVSESGEQLDKRVVIAVEATAPTKVAPPVQAARRQAAAVSQAMANAPLADDGSEDDLDEEPPRRDTALSARSAFEAAGRGEGQGGTRGGRRGGRGGARRGGARRSENGESATGNGPGNRRSTAPREKRDNPPARRQASATHGGNHSAPAAARQDDGIDALLRLDAANVVAPPRRSAIDVSSAGAKKAMQTLQEMLRLLDMQLDATLVQEDSSELHIDLFGSDESRLIGRRGEVLLALQFVLNRILSQGEEDNEQLVVLDAGGYRERRRAALEQLARKLAARAQQENKAVRLSPMSVHDRRIFHLTLKEIAGITTRSEGDGMMRNLLIIPAE